MSGDDASATSTSNLVPAAGADSVDAVTVDLCGATIEELLDAGLKITQGCKLCPLRVVQHARAATLSAVAAVRSRSPTGTDEESHASASSWTSLLQKFVSGNKLPKWTSTSVCRSFLDQLDLKLPDSGLPEAKWNHVFTWVIDDLSAAKWVKENIIAKGLSWSDSKAKFTAHFQLSDYTVALERKYDDCKQARHEAVQHYADRYTDLCNQLSIPDNDKTAIRYFINRLNDSIRAEYLRQEVTLRLVGQAASTSLREVVQRCIDLDTAQRTSSAYASADSGSSGPGGSPASSGGGAKHCKFHPGSTTHSTAECKKKDGSKTGSFSSGGGNPKQERKGDKSSARCYTCNEVGHISPNCPQKNGNNAGSSGAGANSSGAWRTPLPGSSGSNNGGRHSERQSVPPARLTYGHDGQKVQAKAEVSADPSARTIVVAGGADTPSPDHSVSLDRTLPDSVFVPTATRRNILFLYQGVPYDVLLDTGANRSFIDARLVESLAIEVVPAVGSIKQASASAPAARIGTTAPMDVTAIFPLPRLQLPAKPFAYCFKVLPLGDEPFQFIMGCDLIRRLLPTELVGEFMPGLSEPVW